MTRRSVLLPERNVLDALHRVTRVRNAALEATGLPAAPPDREAPVVERRASVAMIGRKALVVETSRSGTGPPVRRRTVRLEAGSVWNREVRAATGVEPIGAVVHRAVLVEAADATAVVTVRLGAIATEVRQLAEAIGPVGHVAVTVLRANDRADGRRALAIVTVAPRPVEKAGRGVADRRNPGPTDAVRPEGATLAAIGRTGEGPVARAPIDSVAQDPTPGHLGAKEARVVHSEGRVVTTAVLQRVLIIVVRGMVVFDQMTVDRGPTRLIEHSGIGTGARRAVGRRVAVRQQPTRSATLSSATVGRARSAGILGRRSATLASPCEELTALRTTPSRRVRGA